MRPGWPSPAAASSQNIEKTRSDTHAPDVGTSNFCSSQIAVCSLSGFVQSHVLQFCRRPSLLVLAFERSCEVRTVRRVPRAQRRSFSSRFCWCGLSSGPIKPNEKYKPRVTALLACRPFSVLGSSPLIVGSCASVLTFEVRVHNSGSKSWIDLFVS